MKIGTKSLLFGLHQFALHPAFVTLAWVKLYHKLPTPKEQFCIVIHDWGYWSKPNIDGPEGEMHPYYAGEMCRKLFGIKYYDFCTYHSGTVADRAGVPVSKLCIPDKYGCALMPIWLMVFLGWLTGESKELKIQPKYAHAHRETMTSWEMFADFSRHYKEKVKTL